MSVGKRMKRVRVPDLEVEDRLSVGKPGPRPDLGQWDHREKKEDSLASELWLEEEAC